jgi:single-strand DNA-binding protein
MSTLKGKIHEVLPIETFSSGFQKQSLIVETDDNYPQFINIEFLKDKTSLLDNLKKGELITVHYNINGKPWTSPQGDVKYFNSITGWKIEKSEGSAPAEPTKDSKNFKATPSEAFMDDSDSELPFN